MPKIHDCVIVVRREHIDEQGHVSNVQFVKWMQDAAIDHSTVQGWSQERYREAGVSWVVRSHAIEYRRPAYEHDEITLLTWVADMGRTRSTRKYKFINRADGTMLAAAETNWVLVDLARGGPCRIPPDVSSAFHPVPESDEP